MRCWRRPAGCISAPARTLAAAGSPVASHHHLLAPATAHRRGSGHSNDAPRSQALGTGREELPLVRKGRYELGVRPDRYEHRSHQKQEADIGEDPDGR